LSIENEQQTHSNTSEFSKGKLIESFNRKKSKKKTSSSSNFFLIDEKKKKISQPLLATFSHIRTHTHVCTKKYLGVRLCGKHIE
jgi:hypothetical protein